MFTTTTLETILDQLREAETELARANTDVLYCDNRTQDILHDLELNPHTYHERGKLTEELVAIRKTRRQAKDAVELLNPLCTWLTNNVKQVNQLKIVLGDMRKIDIKQANRQYYPKTEKRET